MSSLESIFAAGLADNDRSKLMLSSISENGHQKNTSNISDDSMSFCKDNQKSYLENSIIAPITKPNRSDL